MKTFIYEKIIIIAGFLLLISTFTGCKVISETLKAGFWIGIIVVVLVLMIISAIIRMLKR